MFTARNPLAGTCRNVAAKAMMLRGLPAAFRALRAHRRLARALEQGIPARTRRDLEWYVNSAALRDIHDRLWPEHSEDEVHHAEWLGSYIAEWAGETKVGHIDLDAFRAVHYSTHYADNGLEASAELLVLDEMTWARYACFQPGALPPGLSVGQLRRMADILHGHG